MFPMNSYRDPRQPRQPSARHLREHYSVGIIMLTAVADPIDRILGLEMGADDYIGKPFDPRELLARQSQGRGISAASL